MEAECIQRAFEFHEVGGREVIAQFNGGQISSDGGGVLLGEVERRFRFIEKFAKCFTDHRDTESLTHPLVDLLKQRIFGLCLGYEDLNDHDTLRSDRLLAVLVGKEDPEGKERPNPRDRGKALAGKSTLNRLELTPVGADEQSRYKKIVANIAAMQDFLVDAFMAQHATPPEEIVLDFDATDDPIHGRQLGVQQGYSRQPSPSHTKEAVDHPTASGLQLAAAPATRSSRASQISCWTSVGSV